VTVTKRRSEFAERIGVGEPSYAFTTAKGRSPRKRKVIAEEGPRKGKVGGYQTDHPDGRMDATVFAPPATAGITSSLE
jgi:hypothetical protein